MEENESNAPRKKLFLDLFKEGNSSLGAFETRKKELSPEQIALETQQLWKQLRREFPKTGKISTLRKRKIRYGLAASLALLMIAGLLWFFVHNTGEHFIFQTSYGETKSITLPDQSGVMLNANSKLSYKKDWDQQASREVWLEGEAYFQIEKKQRDIKFIVHTEHLEVEVLGTQFNVKERRGTTEVVLNTGKVKVKRAGKEPLLMEPGELVKYSVNTESYAVKTVDPEIYGSWRHHILNFEDNSLGEITSVLEDNYGYTITFQEEGLADERFTTTLSSDNIDILFPMLEESFDLKVRREGKKVNIARAH